MAIYSKHGSGVGASSAGELKELLSWITWLYRSKLVTPSLIGNIEIRLDILCCNLNYNTCSVLRLY